MDPAWITAALALAAAVAGCLAWAVRWTWRILARTTRFLDDFFGEPAHDGLPAKPGVMARLASVEESVAHVVAETRPNHGRSLWDVLNRTAGDVAQIKERQGERGDRIQSLEGGGRTAT